jgi:hypothetical protein
MIFQTVLTFQSGQAKGDRSISYAAMTIGQGIFIGSQAVMLAIGYEAREAWYVADIDND